MLNVATHFCFESYANTKCYNVSIEVIDILEYCVSINKFTINQT